MITATDYFTAKLAVETDASDVHAALSSGTPGFVLIDVRSADAWSQGHVRGAVHIPRADLASRLPVEYPADTAFVVYCWGPGCNGATRAAAAVSALGYPVKEMIGGFEYWAREGLAVDRGAVDAAGEAVTVDGTRDPDPLTAPRGVTGASPACAC